MQDRQETETPQLGDDTHDYGEEIRPSDDLSTRIPPPRDEELVDLDAMWRDEELINSLMRGGLEFRVFEADGPGDEVARLIRAWKDEVDADLPENPILDVDLASRRIVHARIIEARQQAQSQEGAANLLTEVEAVRRRNQLVFRALAAMVVINLLLGVLLVLTLTGLLSAG